MKVKLLVGRSGPNLSQSAGDIIDVDDEEGARMCAAGQAEEVSAPKSSKRTKTEKATDVE